MWRILRSALTENLGSKIVSVLLGLGIWLYVNRQLHPLDRETATAEVKVTDVGKDLIFRVMPEELRVTLRGEREQIRRLGPYLRDLQAVVDAAGKGAGVHDVAPELVGLPSGIALAEISVSPPRVQLRLDRRVSKSLKVSWVAGLGPPAGVEVGEPVIRPRQVVIEGVEDDLSPIVSAQVEIDLDKVDKNNVLGLPVHLYDAQGKRIRSAGITIEPSLVSVTIPITAIRTKVVPVVPDVEKAGEGFDIQQIAVSPAAVTLSGEQKVVDDVASVSTETMTVTGQRGTESRRLRLIVPEGVRVIGQDTVEVNVAIHRPAAAPGGSSGGGGETGSKGKVVPSATGG